MEIRHIRTITLLTLLLAVVLGVVSFFGAFVPGTYARDAASMAAQGRGQDWVDLFIVLPLLVLTLIWTKKGSRAAALLFSGTIFYILYSFVIYAMGVHFNRLFLLYCAVLGLSLYLFILLVDALRKEEVESWFGDKLPVRLIGGFLLGIAVLFDLLWLKDVVPAVISGSVPKTVSDYGLLVNPVHVLDLAVALPGLIVTAVLLMRRQRLGYILTPVALTFILLLAAALIGMVLRLKAEGISDDTSVAGIFTVLALISAIVLWAFMRTIKI